VSFSFYEKGGTDEDGSRGLRAILSRKARKCIPKRTERSLLLGEKRNLNKYNTHGNTGEQKVRKTSFRKETSARSS